jgi:hypothetical protein
MFYQQIMHIIIFWDVTPGILVYLRGPYSLHLHQPLFCPEIGKTGEEYICVNESVILRNIFRKQDCEVVYWMAQGPWAG